MNPPIFQSFVAVFFQWIWPASLAASLLILLVVLLRHAFQSRLSPCWNYALWGLIVVRLLLPASPRSPLSLFNFQRWVPSFSFSNRLHTSSPPATPISVTRPSGFPQAGPTATRRTQARVHIGNASAWPYSLALLWLFGTLGYSLSVGWRHLRFSRLIRRARPILRSDLLRLLTSCREELRLQIPVRLVATDQVAAPAIFGFWKPTLLLPESSLLHLEAQELRLVFLHELTHVKRRDVALNWLLILLQSLHWFNPLIWFAFRQLRSARELYCDFLVTRPLDAGERQRYGNVLIKLADTFSSTGLPASLAPVLNRKSELKRRITMIANPTLPRRRWHLVWTLLAASLTCLTFTKAADKPPAAKSEEKVPTQTNLQKPKPSERGLDILRLELDDASAKVEARQKEVDKLGRELSITDREAQGAKSAADIYQLRKRQQIEAQSNYQQLNSFLQSLTHLTRAQLRAALPTASPDALLSALMERKADTEQRMAELQVKYAPDHPDVKAAHSVLEKIDAQIEERIDGILLGLKSRVDAAKDHFDHLTKELEAAKARDIDRAIRTRPYFEAKRELENLERIREALALRLRQERIDAALNGNK